MLRVWEVTVDGVLSGGPTTAPLALLTDEAAADLDGAFGRLVARLRRPDVDGRLADNLLGSAYVLAGLRQEDARLEAMYRNLSMTLEDSTTYQAILRAGEARGRAAEAAQSRRERIFLLGGQQFGEAPEGVRTAIQAVRDPGRLTRMTARLIQAADWAELLATP